MDMVPFWREERFLGESDNTSIALALFSTAIITVYLAFLFYFILCKSSRLTEYQGSEIEERNLQRAKEFYHESLLYRFTDLDPVKQERV